VIELLKLITPEQIFKYGSWVFVFWVAQFLIKKMWGLLEGKITNIDNNVTINKKLNKDIAVIISQTLTKLEKHDTMSNEAWTKLLTGFDKVLEFLNGRNPAIAKLRAEVKGEIEEIKRKMK